MKSDVNTENDYDSIISTVENETIEPNSEYGNTYLSECVKELKESNLLEELLVKLYDNGHLTDFMMLLKLTKSGRL